MSFDLGVMPANDTEISAITIGISLKIAFPELY